MAQTRHLVLGLMPRGADPDTHWAAGPWCFDTEEDFFPGWEDSFVFGREPLRDPATLDRAVLMAQSLTVDSIPALGRHLLGLQRRRAEENNPVSTLLGPEEVDLPGVYWETLLTPWACTVARQLVERWLRVRAMVEDWGHLPLHVELLPEDCAFSFATEHDFVMSGALGADWNTWLMSRLLEVVWPERWTRSYALPVCASYGQLIPPEDSGSLKQRLRAWARSCVLRLPCPPLRGMRLHQALRYSLALLHPSRQPDASRPLAAHFGSAATGVAHDLPLDPLPIFIGALPQTLAELDHPDHVAPARVPRVRVASVRAHEDTHYRQQLAIWRARGHRVMFVQHGGNVGQVRCLCETPLVEFSQHAFGTWGWDHYDATGAGKGGQFLPLPYPLLANMADQWRGGDDTLLFVGAEMPLYGHRLDSRPTPLQWLQYREDKTVVPGRPAPPPARQDPLPPPFRRPGRAGRCALAVAAFPPCAPVQRPAGSADAHLLADGSGPSRHHPAPGPGRQRAHHRLLGQIHLAHDRRSPGPAGPAGRGRHLAALCRGGRRQGSGSLGQPRPLVAG